MPDVFFASALTSDADFTLPLTSGLDQIADELYAYWRLEEAGTAVRDDFRGLNDTTPNVSLPNESGVIGLQADFQGTQLLSASASPSLLNFDGSKSFTIAFWVHHDSTANNQGLVSKFNETGDQRGYIVLRVGSTTNRFRFVVNTDGTAGTSTAVTSTVNILANNNFFVIADYNATTGDVRLRANLETPVVANHASKAIFQNTQPFRIGSGQFNAVDNIHDGGLDEVVIWGRVLTDVEATILYNGGSGRDLNAFLASTVFFQASVEVDADFQTFGLTKVNVLDDICDQIRHYYRLEEASGTALDVRGTGDLTLGTPPGNATGKIGQARNFIRASAHDIFAASNTLLDFDGTADFTITCWASSDILGPGDKAIWGRFDGPGNDRGLFLFHDSDPTDNFRLIMSLDGSTNAVSIQPTFVISASVVYFLEVTYVSSTRVLQLRINRGTGSQVASAVVPAGTWFSTTIPWTLGDGTGAGDLHLDGLIDELLIHDRVLTTAELDGLYNSDAGVNVNDLLFRLYKTDFEADADFTAALFIEVFKASVEIDADFTAVLSKPEVLFAVNFTADADFDMGATSFTVARALSFSFEAAPTEMVLSVDRTFAFAFEALANFQADPLTVFSAFQVALQADADFDMGLAVTVINQLAFAFEADADFVALLEISDRLFRFDFDATADFTAVMQVERGMAVAVQVDADFTANIDLAVQLLMTNMVVEPNFQAVFGFANLALAFNFQADANFVIPLFTADHDALVNDLLGITDQLENNPRLTISGIGANLDPTVLDTQWQIETLQDETFLEYLKVAAPVFAETTGALPAPVVPTTHGAFFDEFLGVGKDWFDNLYVIPELIDAGFVITEQNIPMQVYSSFRIATRSLDSVVNNVDAGVSLGGGFPLLPETIPPQTGFPFTMIISPTGPPVVDGTFDFVFDVQTILVPVDGLRTILFSLQPETNQAFRERLQFITEVIRLRDEREQRISLRKTPRQTFEMDFKLDGDNRQALEALLFDRQDKSFGIPVWFEPAFLTSPITAGDLVINVDDTSFGDFRAGGLITVWEDERNFEVAEVQSLTTTTITLTGSFTNNHPLTARVYPTRVAFLNDTISGRKNPVNLQETKLIFTVLDNESDLSDTSAFPTFNGKVLLDEPNLMRGTLSETWARNITVIDSRTGAFEVFSSVDLSRRGHTKRFFSDSRERLWQVRQLIHALRGRQVSFYIPTFFNEFTPTVPISSLDDTLTFTNFGYTQFVTQRVPRDVIRVVRKVGAPLIRTVIGSTILSADEERVQVDSTWGVDISLDEIDFVDYLTKVRLDSDEVTITHGKSIGEALVVAPLIEVLE